MPVPAPPTNKGATKPLTRFTPPQSLLHSVVGSGSPNSPTSEGTPYAARFLEIQPAIMSAMSGWPYLRNGQVEKGV
jgi:hypothetical protein